MEWEENINASIDRYMGDVFVGGVCKREVEVQRAADVGKSQVIAKF